MLDFSAALEFGDLGDSFFSFPSALVSFPAAASLSGMLSALTSHY